MEITIGRTYYDKYMNQIRVLDIAENFDKKSKVVLYRKNKSKKVLQSFHDVLISTLKGNEAK